MFILSSLLFCIPLDHPSKKSQDIVIKIWYPGRRMTVLHGHKEEGSGSGMVKKLKMWEG